MRSNQRGIDNSGTRMIHEIPKLHQLYVKLTSLRVSLDMNRERQWYEFSKMCEGLDIRPDDALVGLVRHIQKGINDGSRNPGALKFSSIIGRLDLAEEALAQA